MHNERGYDDQGRLIEAVDDRGDGTGVRTTYGPDGEVTSTAELTGLPPATVEPDLTAGIAAARASLAAATTVAQVRARTIALFDLFADAP